MNIRRSASLLSRTVSVRQNAWTASVASRRASVLPNPATRWVNKRSTSPRQITRACASNRLNAAAVELALSNTPALVLMDVQLPGIDGVVALARLRRDERTESVPVVALTAQAMYGDRELLGFRLRRVSLETGQRLRAARGRRGALQSWVSNRP